jgi:hypothetical protein
VFIAHRAPKSLPNYFGNQPGFQNQSRDGDARVGANKNIALHSTDRCSYLLIPRIGSTESLQRRLHFT